MVTSMLAEPTRWAHSVSWSSSHSGSHMTFQPGCHVSATRRRLKCSGVNVIERRLHTMEEGRSNELDPGDQLWPVVEFLQPLLVFILKWILSDFPVWFILFNQNLMCCAANSSRCLRLELLHTHLPPCPLRWKPGSKAPPCDKHWNDGIGTYQTTSSSHDPSLLTSLVLFVCLCQTLSRQ